MKLTPEQQQQVQTAKVAGENRVNLEFTAEQKANWQHTVSEAQADRDATISQLNKIRQAATQPGFFGDVRRAMSSSRRTVSELAAKIGVEASVLSQFRAAEVELPADALEAIIAELGLRLMQEIPRSRAES